MEIQKQMKLETQCCKNCKKRHMGCHADCADYLKAKEELARIKEQMQKESVTVGYFVDVARRKNKMYREKTKR